MKNIKILLIYVLIISALLTIGYYSTIYLFRIFNDSLFECPYENPIDFDCAYPAFQNLAVAIVVSGILIIFLWYFIFKYFKKYIDQKYKRKR